MIVVTAATRKYRCVCVCVMTRKGKNRKFCSFCLKAGVVYVLCDFQFHCNSLTVMTLSNKTSLKVTAVITSRGIKIQICV